MGRTQPMTANQKRRMELLGQLGCLACWLEAHGGNPNPPPPPAAFQCGPTERHHLLSGGRRRGHDFTIPLCSFHHRGEPSGYRGPSVANNSKAFRERYGTDDELLELTNLHLVGLDEKFDPFHIHTKVKAPRRAMASRWPKRKLQSRNNLKGE